MPFVKLDCDILDSTVWAEPAETSKCWITMLAMSDANGLVRSTIPGIANRSRLSIKATEKAIETFESPDAHSRSLNDQGKRIRRVDGGYQIINFDAYRKKDHTAAARMRRFRSKEHVTRCKRNVTVKSVTVTQAEAEAEADNKSANGSHPTSDWLKDLAKNPAYQGIDVQREFGKMNAWCDTNRKQATRRRFVNWLNRCDKPLRPEKNESPYGKRYMTPAREPTEAELAAQRKIVRESSEAFKKQMRHETD